MGMVLYFQVCAPNKKGVAKFRAHELARLHAPAAATLAVPLSP
jgi:hypothetical protein